MNKCRSSKYEPQWSKIGSPKEIVEKWKYYECKGFDMVNCCVPLEADKIW